VDAESDAGKAACYSGTVLAAKNKLIESMNTRRCDENRRLTERTDEALGVGAQLSGSQTGSNEGAWAKAAIVAPRPTSRKYAPKGE